MPMAHCISVDCCFSFAAWWGRILLFRSRWSGSGNGLMVDGGPVRGVDGVCFVQFDDSYKLYESSNCHLPLILK